MEKKIVLITSEFPPQPGGIGNHALHLSLHLQKRGYAVSVMADHGEFEKEIELTFDAALPVKVVRIPRKALLAITYLNRIRTAFLLLKSNTIVIASGKFSLWVVCFLSLFFKSKNYIAVLHGSELGAGGKWGVKMTRWSLQRIPTLIAVSEFTKALALELCPHREIHVINNGFLPRFPEGGAIEKERNLSLITVGSVSSRKGQQNVIKALPLIKAYFPDVQYHVVGLPKETKQFSALAEQLNVASSVVFHGALSEEALTERLASSKVFFMLSDHLPNGDVEGFGIAVLEANALSLPAIGSKNSGIADAISDGVSGKLVDPHSPEEIVAALQTVLADYENFSRRSKEWSERFYWDKVIAEYLKVIE